MELEGKVSLVSGSSRGIGRAIAMELAEAGSDVVVNYCSNRSAAEDVVTAIRALGRRAEAVQADVSKRDQAGRMVDFVRDRLGTVQVLVNNAGITRDYSFLKLSPEHWHEVLTVNLDGPFNLVGKLLPGMIESTWGRIINITSIVGQIGNFGQINYAVAKGGLIAFTKTLAKEVAKKGVTVNAIAPGFIETDMTSVVPENALNQVKQITPMGRLGKPEEVATVARFIASPRSSFLTGQVIGVNGGLYV